MTSIMDKDEIKIIKGLISYSAKSEIIIEEILSSGIILQLQKDNNIDTLIQVLCDHFSKLPSFSHASEEQLKPITTNLKFIDLLCNLTTISSPDTVSQIAQCFMTKFLQTSVQPTICECFEEEKSNYTSYLQVICENLTHPSLVEKLFEFILSPIIITNFLKRFSDNNYAEGKSTALVSTLRLFKVLLDFYCEDFWYEVVISHVASQNHLIKYQRGVTLPEINIAESTSRFLSLIPPSVWETIGVDLSTYYMEYSFREVSRLSEIDTSVLAAAGKKLFPQDIRTTIVNQNYPLWQYKYDGTDHYNDEISDDEEYKNGYDNETVYTGTTEEDIDDDRVSSSYDSNTGQLTLVPEDESGKGTPTPENERDLLNIVLNNDDMPKFDKAIKRLISVDPQIATLDWEVEANSQELVIMDDEKPCTSKTAILQMEQEKNYAKPIPVANLGTFGPLIDCIFDILNNWSILDMETLLSVTDIVSTLASSRIPLVTSILLDTQLILQPSYPSFQRNLNAIRFQLEALLENYPSVLKDTWNLLQQHEKQPGRSLKTLIESNLLQQRRSNSNSSLVSNVSTDSRVSVSSIITNFGQKFKTSSPFRLAKSQFEKMRRGNVAGGSTGNDTPIPSRIDNERDEQQLLADQKELETARLIGFRTLLFSHWLMELAAIAQQTCWSIPVKAI